MGQKPSALGLIRQAVHHLFLSKLISNKSYTGNRGVSVARQFRRLLACQRYANGASQDHVIEI
jgi:hypothetical protein